MDVVIESYKNYQGRYWVVVNAKNYEAISHQFFSPYKARRWANEQGYNIVREMEI